MTTFAIYQDTSDGVLRVGTFTPRKATSVHHIAEQFFEKQPNMPRGKVNICRRRKFGDRWIDDPNRVLLA